ncbi:MAG: hypothetical protein MSIBF_01660 [Candidatus Altiarchaeales archaeon IMC4]|nr:MAG: hypothetical protein MSIBF_01660 [Candidatus Altiarchaeales archaeon IMC4]
MKGIIKGMWLTIRYALFRKNVTEQYPHEKRQSPNYRGMHKVDGEKCIMCRLCEMNCPNRCIGIELKQGCEKTRSLKDYNYSIDIGKCIWCGICARVCPKQAIDMTPEFELSEYEKRGLTKMMGGEK